jgi:exodeoxyribonuclease VII large subunit
MSDLFLDESLSPGQNTVATIADDFLNPVLKVRELSGQIDWIATQRKVEYIDQLLVLKAHKSVAIRRKLATTVGLLGTSEILEKLKIWQLSESDRQTWLIIENSIDRISRKNDSSQEYNVQIYSVTEAISQIKRQISEKTYTIEGEISEPRLNREMYFFGIKDTQESRIDCWAFMGKIVRMGFALNEGLAVRVRGKFKLSKASKLYFDIEHIELTGEGELMRNLKLLEEKLFKEGLFSPERKRKIAKIPEKILLLASTNSAALTDFTKVLNQRIGGRTVYLLPIKTQGVGAEFEIISKLEKVDEICSLYNINTVVITRGGGSKDDLFVFNSEKIVRQIYSLKTPTIVAIGHERDTTLAELVGDIRASTPSQAAELVCISKDQIIGQTNQIMSFLRDYFNTKKHQYQLASNQIFNLIINSIRLEIQNSRRILNGLDLTINRLISSFYSINQQLWQSILSLVKEQIWQTKNILAKTANLEQQISLEIKQNLEINRQSYFQIQQVLKYQFQNYRQDFNYTARQIDLENPKYVLNKGYSLTFQNKKIITKKSDLKTNLPIQIEFMDGKTGDLELH